MKKTLNVLGICWDYLWMNQDKSKGDFSFREKAYANCLNKLIRIVYSPRNHTELNLNEVSTNIKVIPTRSINKFLFPLDVIRIAARVIKKEEVNLISAEDPCLTGFIGLLLSKFFKIPLAIQIHYDAIDNLPWIRQRKRHRIYNLFAKYVVLRASVIRVVSDDIKHKLVNIGVAPDKIWVIPVMIDADKFSRIGGINIRNKYLDNKFKKIILFVGRLSSEKDILTLLRAHSLVIKNYPEALLLIAGDGPEKRMLENQVEQLLINSNTVFAGAIPYSEISKYFAACDVFVLTSLREGRANVLVEAALSKKPIISTLVSGVQDCIVDNESGFIIDHGDYQKIAEKIVFFLKDKNKAEEFGKNGYDFVKRKLSENNNPSNLISCWENTIRMNVENE